MIDRQPSAAPWARNSLGIDDTSAKPIVVRAVRRLGRLRLERCPDGAPVAAQSRTAIAACLRQRESFVRWVEAPLASPRKALRVFPSLLDVQLPFSIEDCVFQIVDARPAPGGRSSRGLAVGARLTDIEKRLQGFPSDWGAPHVLDHEGLALWTQSLAEMPPSASGTMRAVVYESDDRFTVVIGRGEELLGAHTWRAFEPDAVIRALRLYVPEDTPECLWVWTGPSARNAEAARARHTALAGRWPGPLVIPPDPDAFLARALAIRALTAGPLRFDARQGRLAHPAAAERQRKAPLKAAAVCLVAGLILCLVNAAWMIGSAQRLGRLQALLHATAARAAGSERMLPPGQDRLGAERALAERTRLAAPLLAPFRTPVTATLSAVLAAAQAEGVGVQSLMATRSRVILQATVPTWAHAERVAQRLQKQGWKTKVDRKGDANGRLSAAIMAEVPRDL